MSALIIIESVDLRANSPVDGLATFVQSSWNRGDQKRHGALHETSGFTLSLSTADIDATDEQIKDAVVFFALHASSLRQHLLNLASPKAELIVTTCISPPGAAQETTLPSELVAAAGSLGLSISLRTFLVDENAA